MASIKGGVMTKAVEKRQVSPVTTMSNLINSMSGQIKAALPNVITPERFSRIALTAFSSNKAMQQCTPMSFLGAMMQAAQLGVEPNTPLGQAYLIPYRNKGTMECQFQLGYKGIIDLAYRSGEVSTIQAHEVYENDEFEYEYGLEPKLKHKPALKNRGNVILYYAVLKLKNGGYGFEVMSKDDIIAFAQRKSKAYKYGPWQTDFDEMAKKTVLKKVLKYAPLSTDFRRAVDTDETIKKEIIPDMQDVQGENLYEDIDIEAVSVDDQKQNQPEFASDEAEAHRIKKPETGNFEAEMGDWDKPEKE